MIEVLKIAPEWLFKKENRPVLDALIIAYIGVFNNVANGYGDEYTPEMVEKNMRRQLYPDNKDVGAHLLVALSTDEGANGNSVTIEGKKGEIVGGLWTTGRRNFPEILSEIALSVGQFSPGGGNQFEGENTNEYLNREWKTELENGTVRVGGENGLPVNLGSLAINPDKELLYIAELFAVVQKNGIGGALMRALAEDVSPNDYKVFVYWTKKGGIMDSWIGRYVLGTRRVLEISNERVLMSGRVEFTKFLLWARNIFRKLKIW